MVAGADPGRRQVVGEPVGPLLEPGVGRLPLRLHDGEAVRYRVRDPFEQLGQVVRHVEHPPRPAVPSEPRQHLTSEG